MRCTLKKATRVVVVVCKLHIFIIDERPAREGPQSAANGFSTTPAEADNHVAGAAEVHIEDILHCEPDAARHLRQCSLSLRERLTAEFERLGYRRLPRCRSCAIVYTLRLTYRHSHYTSP
jgi:hypothetical protein